MIRDAIWREVLRGGQVYFVHNNVDTIEKTARELQTLLPDIRIGIAHGQMPERQLETVMADFYHQRFHVLLCTTIIESGIDVPTANTILIDRADRFGLAQLHQMRGRVGRSHHQAYAFLLVPDQKSMTPDAVQRLEAFARYQDLGVGYALATQDLEIRGAGELLGEEQSGHMQELGFGMYHELLERTIRAMKKGEVLDWERPISDSTHLDLHLPALFPDTYIGDAQTRLILYKRLSRCETQEDLEELRAETIDRFGPLPKTSITLFECAKLRLHAMALGVQKIDGNAQGVTFEFRSDAPIEPDRLLHFLQNSQKTARMRGPTQLRLTFPSTTPEERLLRVAEALKALGSGVT